MKVVHGLKKVGSHHGYFLFCAILLTIVSWNQLHSSTETEMHPPATAEVLEAHTGPVSFAVFPLKNETGEADLNWLALGLQEHLSYTLASLSSIAITKLPDLTSSIRKQCSVMNLACLAGQEGAVGKGGNGPVTDLLL